MTPRSGPVRRQSFTVAVVRGKDGRKTWHTKCNRCGQWIGAYGNMTRHANVHFAEQDAKKVRT